ncbi:MAG: phage tail protein I [Clostridiaceae bacterium]
MDLENIDLLSLQTTQMKNDPTTIALCAALTPKFQQLAKEVKKVLIYSRINELDDIALDELANQMHVDFYNTTLLIEVKRELVKNSLIWHKIKGTPAAVEEVAKVVFGRSWVSEWFEYGGSPYMFKVNVEATNRGASPEDFILLEKLVESYKNKRSWLELINILLTTNGAVYFGSYLSSGEEINVYPWSSKEIESKGKVDLALGTSTGTESITIYPKEAI